MNNNHTPGFYILEEERCRRNYEGMRRFATGNPEVINDCFNTIFDRINVVQNHPNEATERSLLAETLAYKQLQEKKKKTLFEKIKEFLK